MPEYHQTSGAEEQSVQIRNHQKGTFRALDKIHTGADAGVGAPLGEGAKIPGGGCTGGWVPIGTSVYMKMSRSNDSYDYKNHTVVVGGA